MFGNIGVKTIENTNGKYIILEDGRVWSTKSNKFLKARLSKRSYLRHNIYDNNKLITVMVHRLVAKYFVPNPNNYNVVNHIDFNTMNNHKDNLEWCTTLQNHTHSAVANRTICPPHRKVEVEGIIYDTLNSAAVATNLSAGNLYWRLNSSASQWANYNYKS